MQTRHFEHAANMVNAIRAGQWTFDLPGWAEASEGNFDQSEDIVEDCYTRAVQTAEAFIILFRAFNPLFDESRFLAACGLVEPAKKGKRR